MVDEDETGAEVMPRDAQKILECLRGYVPGEESIEDVIETRKLARKQGREANSEGIISHFVIG